MKCHEEHLDGCLRCRACESSRAALLALIAEREASIVELRRALEDLLERMNSTVRDYERARVAKVLSAPQDTTALREFGLKVATRAIQLGLDEQAVDEVLKGTP